MRIEIEVPNVRDKFVFFEKDTLRQGFDCK